MSTPQSASINTTMSDTESEHQLQVSEDTIEERNFVSILLLISNGAIDAKETEDYLSYSTLLDVQLSEPANYSIDEQEQLLEQLLKTLAQDPHLVYEIGWDLPSLILPFVESDDAFVKPIRDIPCVYRVIKLFEVLALHGNAKELFLKANELLASIKLEIRDGNWEAPTKIYEVKFYCLFELIVSCLRKIQTLYPSRFLSMVVSTLISNFYTSPPVTMENFQFLLKRIYDFARNYNRPPLPDSVSEDKATLDKIMEDENYLQRKLLSAFVTEGLNLLLKHENLGFSAHYFRSLQDILSPETKYTSAHNLKQPVLDRIYQLTESFDMDLRKVWVATQKATDALVQFPEDPISDDAYRVQLFESLVKDFQKNFAISIVDMDANQVSDSLHGSIALFTYQIGITDDYALVDISFKQALSLGLRILVPGLVHTNFTRRGLQDLAVFWMWVAIEKLKGSASTLELETAAIPPVVFSTYLQCLMFILVSSFTQSYFRFVTLTLITRLLSSAPETIAYDLIMNSLEECPYENVKAALVQILKTLLTRDRIETEQLVNGLDSLKIERSETPAAPPLPSRAKPKTTRYINLTEERFSQIIDVVNKYIDSTFAQGSLNLELTSTLQAYLNLLISIAGHEHANPEEISKIGVSVSEKLTTIKEKTKDDPLRANVFNVAGMLGVSVDRLSDTLK